VVERSPQAHRLLHRRGCQLCQGLGPGHGDADGGRRRDVARGQAATLETPSDEQEKSALIDEITAAFKDVSREDGVTLHEALAIDDYYGPEGRALARAQDTEARWQEVPEEDIRVSQFVLHFLDPKGFRYYLPAYLVWYLRNMDNEDPDFWSNTFDSVDFVLAAGYRGDIGDHYLSFFALLTPEQSKAIAHFLAFQARSEDALEAQYEEQRQVEISSGARVESARQYGIEHDVPENRARRALDRYWSRFI
jgi:hypothetical protein